MHTAGHPIVATASTSLEQKRVIRERRLLQQGGGVARGEHARHGSGPGVLERRGGGLRHVGLSRLELRLGVIQVRANLGQLRLRGGKLLASLVVSHSWHIIPLVVAGVTTNCCVESTVRDAAMRDFYIVVATDGVATKDMHEAAHRASLETMGIYFAQVRPSAEIIESWRKHTAAGLRATA